MKQKGDDYKLTAVKYYLNNKDTMDNICKIFDCKKSSLHRWIQQYKTHKNLGRKPRKAISYKVTKDQVKTALFEHYWKTMCNINQQKFCVSKIYIISSNKQFKTNSV